MPASDDILLAVSEHFMIYVRGGGNIMFLDKAGNLLQSKNGESVSLSANDFFEGFIRNKNLSGTINQHNINRHLGIRTDVGVPEFCDPTLPPKKPCINTFYDARVHYDRGTKRFFILAHSHNGDPSVQKTIYDINSKEMVSSDYLTRRYIAFAVSKTEDPRDGFYQYMTTDSIYADWPRFTVSGGVLIATLYWGGTTKDGVKPTVRLFSVSDMINRHPILGSHKIYANEIKRRNIVDVTHYLSPTDAPIAYILRRVGSTIDIYSFDTRNDLNNFPKLAKTQVILDESKGAMGNVVTSAIYRNGKIYLTALKEIAKRVENVKPAKYRVRVISIPLVYNMNIAWFQASKNPSDGFYDEVIYPSNDNLGHWTPAVAVNKDGYMALVYGRSGIEKNPAFAPDAGYAHGESQHGNFSSFTFRVLHRGEDNISPLNFKSRKSVNVVVDPWDDQTMWMVQSYSKSGGGYKVAIGKISPPFIERGELRRR
jgi:hypothetical protein